MYKFLTIALVLLVSACGSIEQRSTSLEHETFLVVRGELLVGLTIRVEPGVVRTISKSDLTPYASGILGVKNTVSEDLQTVTLKVDEGDHTITVSSGGSTVLRKNMYFVEGQTRELRVVRK